MTGKYKSFDKDTYKQAFVRRKQMTCSRKTEPYLRGPPLKGGHGEESHHGHEDVVKVKVTVVPDALLHHGHGRVPVVVEDVGASAA